MMLEVTGTFYIYSHELGTTTTQQVCSSTWIMKAEKYWLMSIFTSADDAQLEKLRTTTKISFDSSTK